MCKFLWYFELCFLFYNFDILNLRYNIHINIINILLLVELSFMNKVHV